MIRRARIGVDGTAFGDWDYRILLDFGGSGVENTGQFYEAWLQYNGLAPARIRVGAVLHPAVLLTFADRAGLLQHGDHPAP